MGLSEVERAARIDRLTAEWRASMLAAEDAKAEWLHAITTADRARTIRAYATADHNQHEARRKLATALMRSGGE